MISQELLSRLYSEQDRFSDQGWFFRPILFSRPIQR